MNRLGMRMCWCCSLVRKVKDDENEASSKLDGVSVRPAYDI